MAPTVKPEPFDPMAALDQVSGAAPGDTAGAPAFDPMAHLDAVNGDSVGTGGHPATQGDKLQLKVEQAGRAVRDLATDTKDYWATPREDAFAGPRATTEEQPGSMQRLKHLRGQPHEVPGPPQTPLQKAEATVAAGPAADVSAVAPAPLPKTDAEIHTARRGTPVQNPKLEAQTRAKLQRIASDPRVPLADRNKASDLAYNIGVVSNLKDARGDLWQQAYNELTLGTNNPRPEMELESGARTGDLPTQPMVDELIKKGERYDPSKGIAPNPLAPLIGKLPWYMAGGALGAEIPGLAGLSKFSAMSEPGTEGVVLGNAARRTLAAGAQFAGGGVPTTVGTTAFEAASQNRPVAPEVKSALMGQILMGAGLGGGGHLLFKELDALVNRFGFATAQKIAQETQGNPNAFMQRTAQMARSIAAKMDNRPKGIMSLAQLEQYDHLAGGSRPAGPVPLAGEPPTASGGVGVPPNYADAIDEASTHTAQRKQQLLNQLGADLQGQMGPAINRDLDRLPKNLPPGQTELPGPYVPDVPPDRAQIATEKGNVRTSIRTGRPIPPEMADATRRIGSTGQTVTPEQVGASTPEAQAEEILRQVDHTRQMQQPLPVEPRQANLTDAVKAAQDDIANAIRQARAAKTPAEKAAAMDAIQNAKHGMDRAMQLPEEFGEKPAGHVEEAKEPPPPPPDRTPEEMIAKYPPSEIPTWVLAGHLNPAEKAALWAHAAENGNPIAKHPYEGERDLGTKAGAILDLEHARLKNPKVYEQAIKLAKQNMERLKKIRPTWSEGEEGRGTQQFKTNAEAKEHYKITSEEPDAVRWIRHRMEDEAPIDIDAKTQTKLTAQHAEWSAADQELEKFTQGLSDDHEVDVERTPLFKKERRLFEKMLTTFKKGVPGADNDTFLRWFRTHGTRAVVGTALGTAGYLSGKDDEQAQEHAGLLAMAGLALPGEHEPTAFAEGGPKMHSRLWRAVNEAPSKVPETFAGWHDYLTKTAKGKFSTDELEHSGLRHMLEGGVRSKNEITLTKQEVLNHIESLTPRTRKTVLTTEGAGLKEDQARYERNRNAETRQREDWVSSRHELRDRIGEARRTFREHGDRLSPGTRKKIEQYIDEAAPGDDFADGYLRIAEPDWVIPGFNKLHEDLKLALDHIEEYSGYHEYANDPENYLFDDTGDGEHGQVSYGPGDHPAQSLPGAEKANYREHIVQWANPHGNENFREGHWTGKTDAEGRELSKNAIGHYRTTTRSAVGKRGTVHNVEEFQGQWGQSARRSGVATPEEAARRVAEDQALQAAYTHHAITERNWDDATREERRALERHRQEADLLRRDMRAKNEEFNRMAGNSTRMKELTPGMVADLQAAKAERDNALTAIDQHIKEHVEPAEQTLREKGEATGTIEPYTRAAERIVELERAKADRPRLLPNSPYIQTKQWFLALLKHAIHDAVEEGHSHVAWVNGDQQAYRNNAAHYVGRIEYDPPDRTHAKWDVRVENRDGQGIGRANGEYDEKRLRDMFGDQIAQKIINGEGRKSATGARELKGFEDLRVGGRGFQQSYDEQFPSWAESLLKQLGAPGDVTRDYKFPGVTQENSEGVIPKEPGMFPQDQNPPEEPSLHHGFPITEELKALVKKGGLPLMSLLAAKLAHDKQDEGDSGALQTGLAGLGMLGLGRMGEGEGGVFKKPGILRMIMKSLRREPEGRILPPIRGSETVQPPPERRAVARSVAEAVGGEPTLRTDEEPAKVGGPISETLPPERLHDTAAARDKAFRTAQELKGKGSSEFRLYSNPVPEALAALGQRGTSAAALVGLAKWLNDQPDDSPFHRTGMPVLALAFAHGIGWERLSKVWNYPINKGVEAMAKTHTGARIIEKLDPDRLLAPQVLKALDTYALGKTTGTARGAVAGHQLEKLGPVLDRKASDIIEQEDFEKAHVDPKALKNALGVIASVQKQISDLSYKKAAAGIISDEAVLTHGEHYMQRFYADEEAKSAFGERAAKGPSGPSKVGISAHYARTLDKDLNAAQEAFDQNPNAETMAAVEKAHDQWLARRTQKGEIREASYRAQRTITQGYHDLAASNLFDGLRGMGDKTLHPEWEQARTNLDDAIDQWRKAKGPDKAPALDLMREARDEMSTVTNRYTNAEGDYIALPETPALGKLSGAVVKRPVWFHLRRLHEVKPDAIMSYWRSIHTIWNPGTHFGNTTSNIQLAHTMGLPIWEQAKMFPHAFRDLQNYGPITKALTEAGVTDQATTSVLGQGQSSNVGAGAKLALERLMNTTRPETRAVLDAANVKPVTKLGEAARGLRQKARNLYNGEDNIFRVMYAQKLVKDGVPLDRAVEQTRKDLIDFRSNSPAVQVMRRSYSPFILWPLKAIPTMARGVIEHPWRYLSLMSLPAAVDQYARQQVGALREEDLRPEDRRKFGYFFPGVMQLPWTDETGAKPVYNMDRLGVFSGATTAAPPGAIGSKFSEDYPAILQPNGPYAQALTVAANRDLYRDQPIIGENIIRPSDRVDKATDVLEDMTLPPSMAFLRRRVWSDIKNRDMPKAATDAAGFLSLRPRYIRPGEYARHELNRMKEAESAARADFYTGALAAQKAPEQQADLADTYAAQMRAAQDRFMRNVGRPMSADEQAEFQQHIDKPLPEATPRSPER